MGIPQVLECASPLFLWRFATVAAQVDGYGVVPASKPNTGSPFTSVKRAEATPDLGDL